MQHETYTISELAKELGINPSTIRYYEQKGLIRPGRTGGNQRIYTTRDRARLKLILRGKHFNATLDQIGEMIGLPDRDMTEKNQIEKSLWYIDRRMEEIVKQKKELALFESDLLSLRRKLVRRKRELSK
jgi:DNA-binding transcriptional MerR regulator